MLKLFIRTSIHQFSQYCVNEVPEYKDDSLTPVERNRKKAMQHDSALNHWLMSLPEHCMYFVYFLSFVGYHLILSTMGPKPARQNPFKSFSHSLYNLLLDSAYAKAHIESSLFLTTSRKCNSTKTSCSARLPIISKASLRSLSVLTRRDLRSEYHKYCIRGQRIVSKSWYVYALRCEVTEHTKQYIFTAQPCPLRYISKFDPVET